MDEQLRDLATVGAVVALGVMKLDGADDTAILLADEERHAVPWQAPPPHAGHARIERRVEAEGGAAVDAGDEDLRQIVALAVRQSAHAPHDGRGGWRSARFHHHVCLIRDR